MNQQVKKMYDLVRSKKIRNFRTDLVLSVAEDFKARNLTPMERVTERFTKLMAAENPVILDGEKIVFLRTIKALPPLFTEDEWNEIKKQHYIHEMGQVCNISPGYEDIIKSGLTAVQEKAESSLAETADTQKKLFYRSVIMSIKAILDLTERYRNQALMLGRQDIAETLKNVPANGAKSFREALQMFRILHFGLWYEGEYHNTIGRFDKYMYPYLKADLESGRLTKEQAYDLLLEFFISFNKDSDLYPGVQQGDNGQSLVLGGIDENGNEVFNLLSEMCLNASRELLLIDPKINLRVSSKTPDSVYRLGTELTKAGLGFPQYSNDDIVIPGLIAKGYKPEDAANYVVAACWEFIIPKEGMDIPNIGALSFPKVVDRCVHENLTGCGSFDEFFGYVVTGIHKECDTIADGLKNLWMIPAPYMSIFMDGCLETGNDISLGCRYNNYGFHGTGVSTAADSLAAIEKYVFESKLYSPAELIAALDDDYAGHEQMLNILRYQAPKMGNNDDYVDTLAVKLLQAFADGLEGKQNERGGCFRAGTGSAMYYLWHANDLGATADGRRKGEAFGAKYAPSLFLKNNGPLSVIKSFTKPNLKNVINGGPLTMEFHDTLFRDE
ncbi:MAG: hypothetical protein FWF22_02135, partial [Treponema sp.]|nr:hypothetical protein [Treponema sp.]